MLLLLFFLLLYSIKFINFCQCSPLIFSSVSVIPLHKNAEFPFVSFTFERTTRLLGVSLDYCLLQKCCVLQYFDCLAFVIVFKYEFSFSTYYSLRVNGISLWLLALCIYWFYFNVCCIHLNSCLALIGSFPSHSFSRLHAHFEFHFAIPFSCRLFIKYKWA